MEEEKEQANKLKINLLQGKVNKLEKELAKALRKIEIIERSLKR